jgi:hypothetical protein
VVKGGDFSTLIVNTVTGAYEIDPDSLNIPSVPGVYLDQYFIRVRDSSVPPNEQVLIYNVTATVNDTPIGLLPVFRHSTTREIAGYWNFVIHEEEESTSITASGVITVPNTEVLIVGQTETQMEPVDLFRDTDTVIRQLLGSAAYDRTNPGDVLIQIKNNNQDVLDTDDVDGVQTRSFQLSRAAGSGIQTFVVELSDILSFQHSNFLLNRYRSNVGEAAMAIYADDAVSTLPNTTADTILNQIEQLLNLGTRTIIAVMMAATLIPINSAEKVALENSQQGFLNEVTNLIGNQSVEIRSVIVRYDSLNNTFLNIAGSGERPSTGPDILFNVEGYISRNLYGALTDITIIPSDSTKDLRVVITSVNVADNTAMGDIIYGSLSSSSSATFRASRLFTDSTYDVVASGGITVESTGFNIAAGQVPGVQIRQGRGGKNVSELQPGDVLYISTFNFQKPTEARILVSVVSGYKTSDITAQDLFLQIDDGFRFPNNPVFRARANSTTPIALKYNANDLSAVTVSDNSVEFGFDYEINVEFGSSFAGAGLETYVNFPRLGFVTLYFASGDNNQPIYNAYGRGAVKFVIRS